MGLLSRIFGAVVSVVGSVINVVAETAVTIISAAADALDGFNKKQERERLPESEVIKNKARDELKNVNDEFFSILDKYKQRGSLTPNDKKRADYLQNRRHELKNVIDGVDETNVAEEITKNPEAFEKIILDDNRAHIIQGQVGVSVFGKKCPVCSREMQIQWPRSVKTATVNDFFWGCTGWYVELANNERACSITVQFTEADLAIFTRTDSPEANTSNEELTDLVSLPGPTGIVTERMDDVISDQRSQRRGANDYRCPEHGEEMVLRKKHQATSLLDQYFLGCPRWKPNNMGCGYMVKLKSVMQLSTLLKKETGSGVL